MISLKPSLSGPQQVLLSDEDVLEGDRGGVRCEPAQLVEGRRGDPLAAVDDQEGDAVMPALLGRLDGRHDEVRTNTVGDVGLLSVEHEAAVDPLGFAGDAGHVGARAGLGDAERPDLLPGDRRDQVALLLLLGAELPDRGRGDVDVGADAGGRSARAGPGELLDQDGLMQVVAALPAVALLVLQAQQPLGGHLRKDVVREPAVLLPLRRVWCQLSLDEAASRLAQLLVLIGERWVRGHGRLEPTASGVCAGAPDERAEGPTLVEGCSF